MNCEDCCSLLVDYSLAHLEPANEAEVRAHLDTGCTQCNAALDELHEAWGTLAVELPATEPTSRVADELFARIQSERPAPAEVSFPIRSRARQYAVALAALAAMLVGVAVFPAVMRLLPVYNRVADGEQPGAWGNSAGEPDEQIRPVLFLSTDGLDEPAIAAVWDVAAHEWHLFSLRLPPTAADRCYQLWFQWQSGEFTSAGTFTVDATGTGGAVIDLPADTDGIEGVRITLEPTGGSTEPGGAVQFSADVVRNAE
jgi:anti-sigma-K factor RskA